MNWCTNTVFAYTQLEAKRKHYFAITGAPNNSATGRFSETYVHAVECDLVEAGIPPSSRRERQIEAGLSGLQPLLIPISAVS
jgi:hypothetical protein